MRCLPFALLLLAAGVTVAQPRPLPLVAVPLATDEPPLDGRLAGPFWRRAADLGRLPYLDRPGVPAAWTRVRVARTAAGLCLATECFEPLMERVKPTHRERDSEVWAEDCLEVFVQPPGQPYRHFVVNPLGVQFDELGRDARWNADWQVAARSEADRWQVEWRLPWAALGGAPKAGDTWRLNVCRSRRPEPELSAWSATEGGFHQPERFGEIRFGDDPWPVLVEWQQTARKQVRVRLEWCRPEVAEQVQLRLNGEPTDGRFTVAAEGESRLQLTAVYQGRAILRVPWSLFVEPLEGLLDQARRRVAAVPDQPGCRAERTALSRRLERLGKLVQTAPPELTSEVQAGLREVDLQASHLLAAGAAEQSGAAPGSVAYGVESPLTKRLRHQPFAGQPGGLLRLDAARREMDAGQVMLFAFSQPLPQVRATVGEARSAAGAVLPASAFRVRRVGYVETQQPTYVVPHVGLWPDPLLSGAPFDVAPHSFETLWVDVRVPAGQAAGVYRGQLELVSAAAQPTKVPIEVRVRNFTIPARPSLVTAFGVNASWRVPQDHDAYIRNALEHRVTPYGVGSPKLLQAPAQDWTRARALEADITSDRPGVLALSVRAADGHAVAFPAQPLVAGNNRLKFDLAPARTRVERWSLSAVGPLKATGTVRLVGEDQQTVLADKVERVVEVAHDGWLGAWPTWTESGWDRPDVAARIDWSAFDAAVERYLPLGLSSHIASLPQPHAAWAREYQRHLSEKGWLDLAYTYLMDEPEPKDYPEVNRLQGAVKRAAPGLRNMMTARAFPPELKYVDIWCPEAHTYQSETARQEQARKRSVWWYVAFSCRHPVPNIWIDYPALDCRVWPWMTWKFDIDGMLYWSVTYWSGNPWRNGMMYPGANGDGHLLYPGEDGQPVDSIRWECLRDGLEDYEVLCLLKAAEAELAAQGGSAELRQRIRALVAVDDQVVKSVREWSQDPARLLAARRAMSDALEAAVAALGHEPEVKARPRRRPGNDVSKLPPEAIEAAAAGAVKPWTEPALAPADGLVLRYDFDNGVPFAFDRSGQLNHGRVEAAQRVPGRQGQALAFGEQTRVHLPAGAKLLGVQPDQGTVAVWVRPDFAPTDLPDGLWDGYRVIAYLMQTDGNGLPDGYDEIGLFCHGRQLVAKCAGANDGPFAVIASPLQKGVWTHLALRWTPERRTLLVDGKPVADRAGRYVPPKLDDFAGALGWHPASRRWPWQGALNGLQIWRRGLSDAEVAELAR